MSKTQHKGLRGRESGGTVNLAMVTLGEDEPIRIRYGGTTYNIWTVGTGDTWASEFRVRHGGSKYAIRYLTEHTNIGGTHTDWTDTHGDWYDGTHTDWDDGSHTDWTDWDDAGYRDWGDWDDAWKDTHYQWSDHDDGHTDQEPHTDWTNEHDDGTHTDSYADWWDHGDWTDYHNDGAHLNWGDETHTDGSPPCNVIVGFFIFGFSLSSLYILLHTMIGGTEHHTPIGQTTMIGLTEHILTGRTMMTHHHNFCYTKHLNITQEYKEIE